MNPATINSSVFTVTGASAVLASSVVLDNGTGTIATFTPAAPLVAGVQYTATIKGGANGVKDLAVPRQHPGGRQGVDLHGGQLRGSSRAAAVALGAAAPFGAFGGSAGVTNQGLNTVINGNIGTTAVVDGGDRLP